MATSIAKPINVILLPKCSMWNYYFSTSITIMDIHDRHREFVAIKVEVVNKSKKKWITLDFHFFEFIKCYNDEREIFLLSIPMIFDIEKSEQHCFWFGTTGRYELLDFEIWNFMLSKLMCKFPKPNFSFI